MLPGDPGFTVTVPVGFTVREISSHFVVLGAGSAPDAPSLIVVTITDPGVVNGLARSPAYQASSPAAFTVGTLAGRAIDIEVAAGGNQVLPVVSAPGVEGAYVLHPGTQARVIELSVGASTIVIVYDAPRDQFGSVEQQMAPILASLAFGD